MKMTIRFTHWKTNSSTFHCPENGHTILPTPGDPTNMILSAEDTSASPVSANLRREKFD